jgi:hypothetical protein
MEPFSDITGETISQAAGATCRGGDGILKPGDTMTIENLRSGKWKKPRPYVPPRRAEVPAPVVAAPRGEGPQPHPGRRMTEEEFQAWVDEETRAQWFWRQPLSKVTEVLRELRGKL